MKRMYKHFLKTRRHLSKPLISFHPTKHKVNKTLIQEKISHTYFDVCEAEIDTTRITVYIAVADDTLYVPMNTLEKTFSQLFDSAMICLKTKHVSGNKINTNTLRKTTKFITPARGSL